MRILKLLIMTILVALSINVALADRVVVSVGGPGSTWVPGHWAYGRWIPGHYVSAGYYRTGYYYGTGYRYHHRWHHRYW